jgi:hypothetical protein
MSLPSLKIQSCSGRTPSNPLQKILVSQFTNRGSSRYPRLQFFLLCRHITSLLRFQRLCGVWPVSVSCAPINVLAVRVSLALPSRVCIILARTFFLLPRLLYLRSDVTHLKQKAALGQYSLPFGVLSSRRITHVQRIQPTVVSRRWPVLTRIHSICTRATSTKNP